MDYQVALSPSAHRDLRDIVRYISIDSHERALDFGRFLISNTRRLGLFPDWGRAVPEFANPDIREIVVRTYRVIYRVDRLNRRVDVIRFWHGARGFPAIPGA